MNKKLNWGSMSVDEMWQLHEEVSQVLSVRLTSEKRELEKRLEQLRRDKEVPSLKSSSDMNDLARATRRKYPRVYPKYQNPQVPSETWSGRGKLRAGWWRRLRRDINLRSSQSASRLAPWRTNKKIMRQILANVSLIAHGGWQ